MPAEGFATASLTTPCGQSRICVLRRLSRGGRDYRRCDQRTSAVQVVMAGSSQVKSGHDGPIPRRQTAPELCHPFRPHEGVGNAGRARRSRSLACESKKHTSVVTTVAPVHPAFPHADGFTAYSALSPVTGLSCHRRERIIIRKLDISVGISGPHDFAVRKITPSSVASLASTASRTQRS
jgi:hypothetical protein